MSDDPDKTLAERVAIKTAPERIYLQISDDEAHYAETFEEAEKGEVTWCADSVVACEVPYVRADRADELSAEVERLRRLMRESAGMAHIALDEVERLRACERDARRYREVRKWKPITFMNATQVNLKTGKPFDEIVDDLMPFTDAAIAREAGT